MKIEKVSLEDLNEILKLEKKTFKNDAFSKETIKKLIQQNSFFLKLVRGSQKKYIIGFLVAIKDGVDRINIINFLVKEKYQNNGYGSFLLEETMKRIKKITDIKWIILNVKITNTKAINLYQKYNFQIVQEIQNYYRQQESAYLMQLKIQTVW